MSAYLSPCRTWRYSLTRELGTLDGEGTLTFVGLNPSTADETTDDPTIGRCKRYARDWGYARLKMVNLYAFRTPSPHALWEEQARGTDIVGPENDHVLSLVFGGSDMIVAAWGASAGADRLAQFADTFGGWQLHALGLTKDGQPRHPLYMRTDAQPFIYGIRAAA